MAGVYLRAGRLREALAELDNSARRDWGSGVLDVPLKAIVLARSGRLDEARAQLVVAMRFAQDHAGDGQLGHWGGPWWDWYAFRFYLREAEALILYDPKFPADPFRK